MKRLEGVLDVGSKAGVDLKRYALFFDRLHVIENTFSDDSHYDAELSYLSERNFVRRTEASAAVRMLERPSGLTSILSPGSAGMARNEAYRRYGKKAMFFYLRDLQVRLEASGISEDQPDVDSVPICQEMPERVYSEINGQKCQVLEIAIRHFPTPGPMSSWEDILNFTQEKHDKLWDFRRFLNTLVTKKQTEAEILDDFEWSLHEYSKEMDRFKLKRSVSFVETYVIPTIEAIEGLKPSAFLRGLVSIRKRKIELLEGEAKAAGRECAYLFDAHKTFRPSA
jgi:hypothetical protein